MRLPDIFEYASEPLELSEILFNFLGWAVIERVLATLTQPSLVLIGDTNIGGISSHC